MASTTARSMRSSGPVIPPISAGFRRSKTPAGRLANSAVHRRLSPSSSLSSDFFTPASSYTLNNRTASPTRVGIVGSVTSSSSVSFSVAHQYRDNRIVRTQGNSTNSGGRQKPQQRKTCMCSPTTHPGSFRCALHKNAASHQSVSAPSHRLNARRSAMTNSLVRIGTVEGDLVKTALAALIRPSSHQQRRRGSFQPRPSRLSVMSVAGCDDNLAGFDGEYRIAGIYKSLARN